MLASRRLEGKVAFVTGAGSGIGRAIALRFSEEGAKVAVADLDLVAAEQTVGASRDPTLLLAIQVDVTDGGQVTAAFQQAVHHLGRLDVLVNNAGIACRGTIEQITSEAWERCLAVNLTSIFTCTRVAMPLLRQSGGGTIINVASVAGLRAVGAGHAYTAAKGGVVALTRALAETYAPENIRVRAICPTAVDTPLVTSAFVNAADPAAARAQAERREPTGRLLLPAEVAALAVYLASDEAFPFTPEPFVV